MWNFPPFMWFSVIAFGTRCCARERTNSPANQRIQSELEMWIATEKQTRAAVQLHWSLIKLYCCLLVIFRQSFRLMWLTCDVIQDSPVPFMYAYAPQMSNGLQINAIKINWSILLPSSVSVECEAVRMITDFIFVWKLSREAHEFRLLRKIGLMFTFVQ